eukprot:m.63998 g.63998  ORF g.63998 m.63998 type:complete len:70 (+) comp11618_c0_seq2:2396-2605(+)
MRFCMNCRWSSWTQVSLLDRKVLFDEFVSIPGQLMTESPNRISDLEDELKLTTTKLRQLQVQYRLESRS